MDGFTTNSYKTPAKGPTPTRPHQTSRPTFSTLLPTHSFYSKTKAYMEDMLKSYANVLILRVRMPISDDLNPRNFVTKIIKYDKVVDVPNSMTVLHDLLPVSLVMAQRKLTGAWRGPATGSC